MTLIERYRYHFKWKYIGYRMVLIEYGEVPLLYFMTESGRRRIEIPKVDGRQDKRRLTAKTTFDRIWTRGGPFPKDFKEEADTLGSMLSRMVDKKLIKVE